MQPLFVCFTRAVLGPADSKPSCHLPVLEKAGLIVGGLQGNRILYALPIQGDRRAAGGCGCPNRQDIGKHARLLADDIIPQHQVIQTGGEEAADSILRRFHDRLAHHVETRVQ
ncbi:hypothetical protein [Methanoculleus sp.]|uniref:Uncharacterized protein n=1 Tax=Methanoculleus palmolei TaxID=72612 RepID=A0ABD8ABE0_9EURY|nr:MULTISPECIES: hypothetical protein [unclassified Methanoculleus]WOX56432.1 hypothetical protein R6Y95_03625 [Methanoculleus palmolei]MCK9320263.1 hypothetical protein [Methanoculleus sp.]MDD2252917.1 hypothetical protein [Methanoculleus sp.]MDD2786981.1 hypothetical protein [Methanoculleus sp.]MDD3217256.1 hypothetical protein [Methanoculleus sp.]